MRSAAFVAILASSTVLSGCAGTIAGVSFSSISSFAGFASTLFTGADLGEHAASLVTGKNCRFSEGLVRADREICEENGSLATRKDFHGIFVERIDEDGTVIYAAPKYMPASVGAGENENNTDVVWAQIKAQKAQEERERQIARVERNQQIDVAALASGSLSQTSMGFLPVGFSATVAQSVEEEPASQTAARPRDFSNSAQSIATKPPQNSAPAPRPADSEQPAIDERTFTASMQIANATGQGGPFIAAVTTSAPVVSTLVNGEPVVVMRIGPVISPSALSAPGEHIVSATPTQDAPSEVAQLEPVSAEPESPQALISSIPKTPSKPTPAAVAVAEAPVVAAPKPVVKPKAKPAPVQVASAAPAVAKPAKTKPAPAPLMTAEEDVYQPQGNDAFTSPAPDLTAAPSSEPAPQEHSPEPVVPPATSAPAPLIPMAQP